MAGTSAQATSKKSTFKILAGTGVGNCLEWFDWNVYATFAVFFSAQLFDNSDPTSAFLSTMAVFAVGFVARPFGGFLFGWLADRIGRKHSLTVAVLAASFGSLLIACAPTYSQVGWLASAILVVARLIQGLSHGGELPSAQTYLAEHAPKHRRGLWASTIYVTGTSGVIIGMLVGLLMETSLSSEQMYAWGWRVPFLVGALLGLFALWMRMQLDESEVFEAAKQQREKREQKENVFASVARNWRTALQVIGITCGLTVSYYVWSVTMPSLAQSSFGYTTRQAFGATIVGNVFFVIMLPVWGWVSDHWGRKPTMVIALAGNAICYLPLVYWIEHSHTEAALVISLCLQLGLLAGFLGHAPAAYAEMFPTDQRASGFGIPYAIAIAAFGGTAAYLLTWMGNTYHFAIYSIILLAISTLTVFTLKETKGIDLHH